MLEALLKDLLKNDPVSSFAMRQVSADTEFIRNVLELRELRQHRVPNASKLRHEAKEIMLKIDQETVGVQSAAEKASRLAKTVATWAIETINETDRVALPATECNCIGCRLQRAAEKGKPAESSASPTAASELDNEECQCASCVELRQIMSEIAGGKQPASGEAEPLVAPVVGEPPAVA